MKLFVEDISKPAVLIGQDLDPTPTGYLDKTTIYDIGVVYKANVLNLIEYNSIRDWLLDLLLLKNPDLATAFGLCDINEKKTICQYILMPYNVRTLLWSDAQDSIHWDELVMRTEGTPFGLFTGRAKVYQLLRIKVSDYVRKEIWVPGNYFANLTMAQLLFRDVVTMKDLFIGANDPEFKEILSSSGRYDATTGFKGKTYWLESLETDLLTIYNSY